MSVYPKEARVNENFWNEPVGHIIATQCSNWWPSFRRTFC